MPCQVAMTNSLPDNAAKRTTNKTQLMALNLKSCHTMMSNIIMAIVDNSKDKEIAKV